MEVVLVKRIFVLRVTHSIPRNHDDDDDDDADDDDDDDDD